MKKLHTHKLLTALLCMALSLFVFQAGFAAASADTLFTGSISMDVNPSIELVITDGVVTQAIAYNDDGRTLLTTDSVQGLTAEEAVAVMTRLLIENGYLASEDGTPVLLITASGSGSETIAGDLQDAAQKVADEYGVTFTIKSSYVTPEVEQQAQDAGLTAGKYLMMQTIADSLGITLEEALALYGSDSISALLLQFPQLTALLADGEELLTEDQQAVLEAAFALEKDQLKEAESAYHDAIKDLKALYRGLIQDAAKNATDDEALAATLDQLMQDALKAYAGVQQTFDDAVAAYRDEFQLTVDGAEIPGEMTDQFASWHVNKQENASDEFTKFLEQFIASADNGNRGGNTDKKPEQANGNQNKEEVKTQQQLTAEEQVQTRTNDKAQTQSKKKETNTTTSNGNSSNSKGSEQSKGKGKKQN